MLKKTLVTHRFLTLGFEQHFKVFGLHLDFENLNIVGFLKVKVKN